MTTPTTINRNGAAAVITHRIRSDSHSEYESWLEEIASLCRAATGHLDWSIVRPIPGVTETYTMIIRFDTDKHLKRWMDSSERQQFIQKVRPLLVGSDDFYISSGLDFWFMPAGAKAKIPVRWKQYLLTWSAIYPLSLGVSWAIAPALRRLGITANLPLAALVGTAITVFLMVYVVMPRYTRLMQRWLFR